MTTTLEPLDLSQPQQVAYAVPLWLRDEQIRVNLAKVPGRIAPIHELRTDPIAIVCFGPSLNDTWEQIKGFRYVMTCSGAHRFLIDRGIVPNWHVDVDPRAHKVALIGEPHRDVEYLLSSTCHPSYFELLQDGGFNVKLWHVFSNAEDSIRTLPPGEWALFGGSDAGMRAMVVARFLGFTEQHIFGMDGCEGKTGKHAAAHPNQAQGHRVVVIDGVEYKTTIAMAECARQIPHELNQLPDVNATFYGEGLTQAIARSYQRTQVPTGTPTVAFVKPALITPEYAALNAQLHKENLAYGVGGGKHAKTVIELAERLKTRSVLDYGCGKGYLAKAIPFPIWEYDPAIPGKQESPRPADLVCCTDVLEHVEPENLTYVLDDLRRCVKQIGYFTIHTGPAVKFLSDNRNAHLIQQGKGWWQRKLSKFFTVGKIIQKGPELHVIVAPKGKA
jgi:uncharacterized Rossmann fold enzyme